MYVLHRYRGVYMRQYRGVYVSIYTYWEARRKALDISRELGEIRVWIEHGRFRVSLPDDDFADQATALGGRQQTTSGGTWSFSLRARSLVETCLERTYGKGSTLWGPPTYTTSPLLDRVLTMLCPSCLHRWMQTSQTVKWCPQCHQGHVMVIMNVEDFKKRAVSR